MRHEFAPLAPDPVQRADRHLTTPMAHEDASIFEVLAEVTDHGGELGTHTW